MLHTCSLSKTSTLYYSVYFSARCLNLQPINITSKVVPVMATIRYKFTSDTVEELIVIYGPKDRNKKNYLYKHIFCIVYRSGRCTEHHQL